MTNIIPFSGLTKADADEILDEAKGELDAVLVLGFDHEGGYYITGNIPDGGTVIWLLEQAKKQLLAVEVY